MVYSFLFLIFFTFGILCFYTNSSISTIRFKRKYDIKPIMTSVEIIRHIIVYMVGIINIGICIWKLFNN